MEKNQNIEELFSVRLLFIRLKKSLSFIKQQNKEILFILITFIFLFISYNYMLRPTYFARTTFVLDTKSSEKIGDLSSIASLAGISSSSLFDENSLFQIDNIQDLYRSDVMIKKTLLSLGNFGNKSEIIINRMARFNNDVKKWSKQNISFKNSELVNRSQDSVIKVLTETIKEDHLIVNKPSRKTTILEVGFDHRDQELAKVFNENLVEIVNDFYLKTKTLKTGKNLEVLKKQSDSVKNILNYSIQILAELDEKIPNSNPLLKTNETAYQKVLVDVQANTVIYEELVKQLELARVTHRNNTPLIQIIDTPILPLKNSKWKLYETALYGILAGLFFNFFYFFLIDIYRSTQS